MRALIRVRKYDTTAMTPTATTPASLLNRHYRLVWWGVLMLLWVPASSLLRDYLNDDLGVNALETLQRTTGRWAVIALILTLAVTPTRRALVRLCRLAKRRWGRRLSDWNTLMRMRRMLGLSCFAYAALHAGVYLAFDLSWDWAFLADDATEKPYILAGALNLFLLALLAATSPDRIRHALKGWWRRIHRLVYVIALLAIAHWVWMLKPGDGRATPYLAALLALLGIRLLYRVGWMTLGEDDGMPAMPRPPQG
ncbi:MAG: ferric reductase-like transmembrane domain-containing protein [Sulfuricella sp.]|nr:ferric reductase-like transmembrane domain-containing protein [Sulfuricella sp.]